MPLGKAAQTASEASSIAEEIAAKVIIKVQAWITGRAAKGGIQFADSPGQAKQIAEKLLEMKFGNFPVCEILVEQAIDIKDELFVSIAIDDAKQAPMLLLDAKGGSGIEDRADTVAVIPIDLEYGVDSETVRKVLVDSPIDAANHDALIDAIGKIVDAAKQCEARSLEVNPLVTTKQGEIVAADCRMTIDDYAVFRHPELGIEIARELDHPPTKLERIAYDVEQADHRGTFYFAQLPTDEEKSSKGLIGFHGAGGGGSMMSMDAVSSIGFTLANFCDTSGNPSAAKVYRAARIILAQPNLVGYFGSGSGVASQEQYHSAYGLAKAFWELQLAIPAVIRLGGNSEDRAVEILQDGCKNLPTTIEGYKKDDTPAFIAKRFAELVTANGSRSWTAPARNIPDFVGNDKSYSFAIEGGTVWIDHKNCNEQTSTFVVSNSSELLTLNDNSKPITTVSEEDLANKDSEMIALEIECRRNATPVVFVDLPISGLDPDSRLLTPDPFLPCQ